MDSFTQVTFDKKNTPSDWCSTDTECKTLPDLFNACAMQYADCVAVEFYGKTLTYKSLYGKSNQLAKLLIDNGIEPGDMVGLAVDRSPAMVIALLAILKAGAAYVPLDPEYPKDRVEFMLTDSMAKILLTSQKYKHHFESAAREILIEEAWEKLDAFDKDPPEIVIDRDNLAYLLYTSGSTGKPKGVLIRHYNLINLLLSMQKVPGINANDKLLAISTISFDIAGLELFLPIICGAQIVLADAATAKDGWMLLDIIRNKNITIMQATPYTWRMVLEAGWDNFLPLKIICGGEALPKDLADKLIWRCSELWNQYGPTETTIYSTQKLIKRAENITIGKPIDKTQVYILDDGLSQVADGVIGEVFIAGEGVAKGYWNRPELTDSRFVDNPFSGIQGDKMYRTGDLGRIDKNDEIQYLGRIDQQVKIRGYRIELGEIEYELLKDKAIKKAVVVINDEKPGEPGLLAYLVSTNNSGSADSKIAKESKRKELLKSLPAYMVPDDFVFISSIPVTPNGKVDRDALSKLHLTSLNADREYIAPRSKTEKMLAKIWQDSMGIEKISVKDNFFSLGGHSLVAVQIMARIEKVTGKRRPIATLFEHSTIEELSLSINSKNTSIRWHSLVPIKPSGTKKPLYIIHGEGLNVLYFNALATNMDKEQPVYGLQARGLKGDAPLEVMEAIAASYIDEIIAHNPDGPYLLAGYSFGGYIAVEMRKQLAEKGKDVKVIIFDTDAEKSRYNSWLYLLPKKLQRHLPKFVSALVSAVKHPVATFKNWFAKLKKTTGKPGPKEESKEFFKLIKEIRNKLRFALYNYSLMPFDDKIYLFKAKICTHYVEDKVFLGWKRYAKKGVEIFDVPGDHLSMLLPPNVEEFASILQRIIDRNINLL